MDGLDFTITKYTANILFIRLGSRDDELDFFFPVDKGTNSRYAHNGA